MNEMARQQERIANNLANAGTVGYRRERSFTEVLNERLDAENSPISDRATVQFADSAQGAFESTGNPLDVAISGEGFFVLSDPDSGTMRYTRAGQFTQDADGTLRNPAGYMVEGEGGPIQIPQDGGKIHISLDGEIKAGDQVVGKLRVVTFENPLQLQRLDGAAFSANGMEPDDVPDPKVRQGFLEQSNVDPMKEMTDMITHYRLFESQQKSIQTQDHVLSEISRELGKF